MAKSKQKSIWLKLLSGIFYVSLCALAIGVGVIGYVLKDSSVGKEVVMQSIRGTKPEAIFDKDSVTMLVLGCDEDRYYGGKQILSNSARSDMMLLTKLDFKKKRLTGVSIPRDLLVEMPGFRANKINAFHAMGGKDPEKGKALAKQAVEYVLGLKVDKVITLNFEAFKDMIDLVGGVEVFVEKPLHYDDRRGNLHIHLDPGRQVLKGEDAMGFVRYRKGDSDFKRQERQKSLMFSFRERVMSQPGKLGDIAEKARELTGHALDEKEIAAVALFAQKIGSHNIKMGQVPVRELERFYFLGLDYDKLNDTMVEFNFPEARPTLYHQYGYRQ